MTSDTLPAEGLADRLRQFQATLEAIERGLARLGRPEKEAFTPAEFGAVTGLSTYTVQDHCRRGRIRATKALSGRGAVRGWRIAAAELSRFQLEGLLPDHSSVAPSAGEAARG